MPTIEEALPLLKAGDRLGRDEFMRRWEAHPSLKQAELIRGVVHMASPLSVDHGDLDGVVAGWLGSYAGATPGCRLSINNTWLMTEDSAPQPDTSLRILPEFGGRSRLEGRYTAGAPEFLCEISLSSSAYDLDEKLALYQEVGVQEYLAVLVQEGEVRWHRLNGDRFEVVPLPADGIYRSEVFPGLWLDAAAVLVVDLTRVLAVLKESLASPAHAEFVAQLAARRRT